MSNNAMTARKMRTERDHARMLLGDMILDCFPDGWQTVDFEGVASVIRKNGAVFGRRRVNFQTTEEASARMRQWEADNR